MTPDPVILDGESLVLEDVIAVARGAPVALDPAARPRIERAYQAVKAWVEQGAVAYGITTGFGAFKDRLIPPDRVLELQRNLVRSHAAGVGRPMDEPTTRAMLLIRANTLAKGYSGVRPVLVETLIEMLNRGVHPLIPRQGSLGASGDLAPLAHLALVVMGEGEAIYRGEQMAGGEAMRRAGLTPLVLQAKEGLALVNGTAQMTAIGVMATYRAENLARAADIAGALSLEAMYGTPAAFDLRLHAVRPHPRQMDSARYLNRLLEGSTFTRPYDPYNIQDAYSLRCMPQVHGAVRDAIAYARWVLEIELNAATDNPLIFVDEEGRAEIISGGNFHGEPVAIAMDYLTIALTELGNISERRVARLVDPSANGGLLPPFLTRHGGLESGFMLAQYTAAALCSENKALAHPASIDTIPTSANIEDHVSLGPVAARQARRVLEHVETIVGIELLCAAQAVDFRREALGPAARLGRGTEAAYRLIRRRIPFLEQDTVLAPLIEKARELVVSGELVAAVEEALGEAAPDLRRSGDEVTT
ncbi:MAG: histidine ammonia-lyase [Chloroflexi bacterium]|nr:MAG: histidine ammonia-lyase [Chloroflexota bacterium]